MDAGLFPDWTWIIGFTLGAFFGSFLNMVIHRLPRGISFGNPRFSFCPKCHARLVEKDLVPLLSYLFLRGRCRYCKAKVSPRYFVVELINGCIWGAIWWKYIVVGEHPITALTYASAASTLVAIVFIDWELYLIPDQLNAFLWFLGIFYNVWLFIARPSAALTWGIPSSVAGWIVGVGVLWGIALFGRIAFGKDAMGHGDIKMARGIGAVIFPAAAMVSFAMAVVLGSIFGVVQILLRREAPAAGPSTEGSEALPAEPTEGGLSAPTSIQPVNPQQNPTNWEPESLGSLLKSGIGYLLCIDIVGLFIPRLYERWFGEPPFVPLSEEEDFEIERTMIPFGPYLALGAIGTILFRKELLGLVDAYIRWASGPA